MMNNNNCDNCRIKDDCQPLYPCEWNNKLEDKQRLLHNYMYAVEELKRYVEKRQEEFQREHAYSSPEIDDIDDKIEELTSKLFD